MIGTLILISKMTELKGKNCMFAAEREESKTTMRNSSLTVESGTTEKPKAQRERSLVATNVRLLC